MLPKCLENDSSISPQSITAESLTNSWRGFSNSLSGGRNMSETRSLLSFGLIAKFAGFAGKQISIFSPLQIPRTLIAQNPHQYAVSRFSRTNC
jgi:hypothetical protein